MHRLAPVHLLEMSLSFASVPKMFNLPLTRNAWKLSSQKEQCFKSCHTFNMKQFAMVLGGNNAVKVTASIPLMQHTDI